MTGVHDQLALQDLAAFHGREQPVGNTRRSRPSSSSSPSVRRYPRSLVSATVSISFVTSSSGRSAVRAKEQTEPEGEQESADRDEGQRPHEIAQLIYLTVDVGDEQFGRRRLDQTGVDVRARPD